MKGSEDSVCNQRELSQHCFRLPVLLSDKAEYDEVVKDKYDKSWRARSVKSFWQTSDTEAKDMKKIYDDVLETEDTFAKDMEGLVDHREILNVRKKEILHKKWRDAVDGPLSTEVTRVMNGPQYRDLVHRKRLLYKEYLEHVNKKGHVFLDTIAPEEYYPLALYPVRPSMLVAETSTLGDPLLMTERQRCGEERVIVRCMTGSTLKDRDLQQIRLPPVPLVPLGRHGTGCDTWLAMPIADIESPVRLASRRRMTATANASHFRLDAWGRAASQSLVDTEMRIQKRRPRPQSDRRTDFDFDLGDKTQCRLPVHAV